MAEITQINESNFNAEVLGAKVPVLVYFWASWCGPCTVMGPTVEKFAKKENTVKVVKVNVDENHGLTSTYNIMSVPTLLFFRGGNVKDQRVGVVEVEDLRTLTKK